MNNNIDRLKQDHLKAKEIGELLTSLSYIKRVEPVETNIVIFELDKGVNENTFLYKLEENNVKLIGMGSGKLRMVTHLDYTNLMHDHVLSTLSSMTI